jgi:hypothetical protein
VSSLLLCSWGLQLCHTPIAALNAACFQMPTVASMLLQLQDMLNQLQIHSCNSTHTAK